MRLAWRAAAAVVLIGCVAGLTVAGLAPRGGSGGEVGAQPGQESPPRPPSPSVPPESVPVPPAAPTPPGIAPPGAPVRPMPGEPADAAARPVFRLSDLAFFEGAWAGEMEGGVYVEEHWSAIRGTSMMGMFRWVNPGGEAALFEILTLTQEGGDVVMRLRHYSATLVAKEEKDKPMTLRLAELEGRRAVFEPVADAGQAARVVYELTEAGTLRFSLFFAAEAGRAPLRLEFRRVEGAAAGGGDGG